MKVFHATIFTSSLHISEPTYCIALILYKFKEALDAQENCIDNTVRHQIYVRLLSDITE